MNPPNSSISNSNDIKPWSVRSALSLGLWVLIGLCAIDVFINVAFRYPTDPKNTNPTQLELYFDYGRSQEGKLALLTRKDPSKTAPITLAGWYHPLVVGTEKSDSGAPTVTFYGMSHAVRLAHALSRVTKAYQPRIIGAPGASTNWAYGAYLRDRGADSRAVVLAFMSGNLAMINTMSAMTWNTNVAYPYTADRFIINNGKLKEIKPPYASFDGYVEHFYNPKKWNRALEMFQKYDSFYDPFIVRSDIFDHSAIARLLRRAYAQRVIRSHRNAVLNKDGFNPNSDEVKIAREIAIEFAANARRNHKIPIIYIVNLLGDSNYLYQALKPALLAHNIPYVSSDTIASPSNPRNYLPDSHFTAQVDNELALALVKVIDQQIKIGIRKE